MIDWLCDCHHVGTIDVHVTGSLRNKFTSDGRVGHGDVGGDQLWRLLSCQRYAACVQLVIADLQPVVEMEVGRALELQWSPLPADIEGGTVVRICQKRSVGVPVVHGWARLQRPGAAHGHEATQADSHSRRAHSARHAAPRRMRSMSLLQQQQGEDLG